VRLWLALVLLPGGVAAENPHQALIDRALIERDRQSAEFSRPELRDFHLRQDTQNRPMRMDERTLQALEREAYPRPPAEVSLPDYRPLPLPGGVRHGVDPIPVHGLGG